MDETLRCIEAFLERIAVALEKIVDGQHMHLECDCDGCS